MSAKKINCYQKEYDKEFLAKSFLYGIAFGKNITTYENNIVCLSVKDEEDVIFAVKKAYIDMSPRTFHKNTDWWQDKENVKFTKKGEPKDERTKEKEDEWQEAKNKVLANLAKKFADYFKESNPKDFNDWHEETCDYFLTEFKKPLDNFGYISKSSLSYGKAQKIVNMTFKYLFCFDDARNYYDKFTPCHVPLDSYILDWYNQAAKENKNPNIKPCKTKWSNLKEPEYNTIQSNIKNLLKENYNPFLAEFYIWAQYRGDSPESDLYKE